MIRLMRFRKNPPFFLESYEYTLCANFGALWRHNMVVVTIFLKRLMIYIYCCISIFSIISSFLRLWWNSIFKGIAGKKRAKKLIRVVRFRRLKMCQVLILEEARNTYRTFLEIPLVYTRTCWTVYVRKQKSDFFIFWPSGLGYKPAPNSESSNTCSDFWDIFQHIFFLMNWNWFFYSPDFCSGRMDGDERVQESWRAKNSR
jgi:hypothetical protein